MVSLANWVRRFPGVRLAQPDDNAALRAFFESAPMKVPDFDIRYERAPHFSDLLRAQGGRFFVFVGEDAASPSGPGKPSASIVGTGTLLLREGWMDGKPATVGIFRDLRVMPSRRNSRIWRALYAGLLAERESIEELKDCRHFQTVILDDNRQALSAFSKLSAAESQAFGLRELAPFRMLNLIARYPWASRNAAEWDIVPAHAGIWPRLEALFAGVQQALAFGFRESLADRLARWPGLAMQDYLAVFHRGELAAFAAPWSPAPVKRTWVSKLPAALSLAEKATRHFPRCGIRLPRTGETLQTLFLTQLTFSPKLNQAESRRVCAALVHHVFDSKVRRGWHCLAVCDYAAWNLAPAMCGFLRQDIPITVYAVEAVDAHSQTASPGLCGFEMGLV